MTQVLKRTPVVPAHAPVRRCANHQSRGFTLIEVMVTVAIVAILAAVAYPSYTAYTVRSNRAAAEGYMLEVTSLQQRYLLDARQYGDTTALNLTTPSNVSPHYRIDTQPKAGATPPGFTITATPQNTQAIRDTACATLTIDEAGTKSATGTSSGDPTACW